MGPRVAYCNLTVDFGLHCCCLPLGAGRGNLRSAASARSVGSGPSDIPYTSLLLHTELARKPEL
jgi:hypothetical protein